MNAWRRSMVDGAEAYFMSCGVLELTFETMGAQHLARGGVYSRSGHAWLYFGEGGCPSIEHRIVHLAQWPVRLAQAKRPRNVCPITIYMRVAVEERRIAFANAIRSRKCIGCIGLGGVSSRHAP